MTVHVPRTIPSLTSSLSALPSAGRAWRPPRHTLTSWSFSHHGVTRAFHRTGRGQAQSKDMPPEFYKLMSSPETMDAIQKMMRMMKAKGIDTDSTKLPSLMHMTKLAMDPDFRREAKTVAKAVQKAGVEIKPERMTELLSGMLGAEADGRAQGDDGDEGDGKD